MINKAEKPDISTLLKDNPAMRGLYEVVLEYLKSLGPVEATPHTTQISFGGNDFKTNFAFVWAPEMINNSFPENSIMLTSIMLTFDLPRHETGLRIHEPVNPRPGRWAHHVLIESAEDLDHEVKGWLRESFELGRTGLREWRKRANFK